MEIVKRAVSCPSALGCLEQPVQTGQMGGEKEQEGGNYIQGVKIVEKVGMLRRSGVK